MEFIELNVYDPYNAMQISWMPDYEKVYIRPDLIESIKSCKTHSSILTINEDNGKVYLVKESPEEIIKLIKTESEPKDYEME
jgi:uncharacterized protein YlzI (FlbEa/FlbD family)